MRAHVAVLVASLAAAPVSWPAVAEGQPQLRTSPTQFRTPPGSEPGPTVPDLTSRSPGAPPPAAWDTFTAEVTIRRRLVKADGTPGLEAPEMRYRWVRTLGDAGWKTTMTLLSVSPDTIHTSKGPQAASRKVPVSRIEIGDPRSPTRVFAADGRMLFMLPTAAPASPQPPASGMATLPQELEAVRRAADAVKASLSNVSGSNVDVSLAGVDPRARDWVEHLVPSAAGRIGRRAALARDLGSPQGHVRGLERFVRSVDGATTEILSDPAWSVPVEINVARDGALVSHSVLSYDEEPGVGLVRRRVRSEQRLSPESGDRALVDFELSNVRLTRGGAR
jgi:hypothetical protein